MESRRGTEENFYIFPNTVKGRKYYFQARYYSPTGKSSLWSNMVGVVAGDYNAPPAITSSDVNTNAYRGTIEVVIKGTWRAAMPSDIKEVRWYAKPRPSSSPVQDWDPDWLDTPYKVLQAGETFSMNDLMQVPLVFDIWAVPVDISGNIPETISRCATGIQAVRPSQSSVVAEIDGIGAFNPDNWFSLSSINLKLTTAVVGEGDGTKKILYSVRVPGGDWGAWQETEDLSVLISILNQGVTYVRWKSVDSLYDDMATEVSEIYVKWDSYPPSTPAKPATSGNSPGSVTWSWAEATDSISGLDHYEVSYQAGSTLSGNWSDPISVSGRSFTINTINDYQYQLRVRSVDRAGNVSTWSTSSDIYEEDTQAPTLIYYTKSGGSKVNPSATGWYNQSSLTLYVEADDTDNGGYSNNSEVQAILYSIGGGVWQGEAGDNVEIALTEGIQDIYMRTLDNANNASTIVSTQIKWDKTAPTAPSFDSAFCEGSDDRISLKWTNGSDSNSGLYETLIYRNDTNDINSAYLAAKIPAGQTSYVDLGKTAAFDNTYPLIPGKTYYYWLRHKDLAGNTSSASTVQAVTMRENMASMFVNYIDNSSFERGSSFPIGWTSGGATYVATGGKHGNKFMRVTNAATLLYDYIFASPGQQYTISAYLKAVTGSPTCRISVQWYDGSGTLLSSQNVDFTSVTSAWVRRAAQVTAPTPGSGYLSHAKITVSSTTSTAVDIDAIQWEEGSAETIYQDTRSTSADRLSAHVIRGEHVVAGAITADKITVNTLSALSANLGNVTAGEMHIGSGASSFHVNTDGDHWAGAALIGDAPFSVTKAGKVTAIGGTFKSAATGARVEIFPDVNTGLVVYDEEITPRESLKVLIGGTNAGDVVIGDYAHGQGILWDASDSKLTVLGSLAVNSIDISTTGFLKGGKGSYSDTANGFWFGYNSGSSKYEINFGDASNYLKWTGTALQVAGALTAGTIDIGGSDATSFHVNTDGDIWSGAAALANAPFSVSSAGKVTAIGGTFKSAATGARVEIFPDVNTGLVVYDEEITPRESFKVLIGGTNAGDVIIGDYAHDQGAMWDASDSLFRIRGAFSAGSIDIGGADATSFHVDSSGALWLGAALQANAPFSVSNTGKVYAVGGVFKTAASGARVEIFPDANTGLVVYDEEITPRESLKVLIGGTNAGDVIIGDYTHDQGAMWDASDSLFRIRGALAAGTIDIGGDDTTSFHVDSGGGLWMGASAANKATAPFRVTSAGAVTATSANITGTVNATAGYFGTDSAVVKIESGGLQVGTGGYIRGTKTGYASTDAGFFLGFDSGTGKMNVGNSTNYFKFDGTNISWKGENSELTTAGAFTASNANITGTVNATAGTIGALTVNAVLRVGASTPYINIDGTNSRIESSNYASGTTGWRIDSAGNAEFNNITSRGIIKTAVFQKSLISAIAGSSMISKSASVLVSDATLGSSFTIIVKPQAGVAPFASGDMIYMKTETVAIYATVGAPSASGSNFQYTATRLSGSSSGTVPAGEAVVDFGVANDGRIILTADDGTNSPYISISTHDKIAPTWTERVRIGNLAGISGASGYGLWTNNGYFTGTVNATSGYFGTGDTVVKIESGGLHVGSGGFVRGEKDNYSDATAGFFIGYESGAYKINIGDATKYFKFSGTAMEVTGATVRSAASGARVEFFPDANTGFVAYDNSGTPAEVFKIVTGGTDVGDVVIGNYAGGQGAKWDKSAGTFSVTGAITANSIDVGTTGYVKGGATAYLTGTGMWFGYVSGDSKYKLHIGDPAGSHFKFDGSAITVAGTVNATAGYFGTGDTVVKVENGGLNVGVGGAVYGGKTSYGDANAGFYFGYAAGAYRISVGGVGNYFKFDGSNLIWAGTNTSLTAAGVFTASNATITGTVNATAGYFGSGSSVVAIESGGLSVGSGGWLRGEKNNFADTDAGFFIGYESGAYKINIGNSTNYFKFDGTNISWKGTNSELTTAGAFTASNATITGTVNATAGTIGALTVNAVLKVGASTPYINIDGTNSRIESSTYASGTSGWRIDSAGNAEFNNITSRGVIKTAVFQKSLISAFAGSSMISKSASVLVSDATLSSSFTIVVKPQAGAAPFASGDMIYMKTETVAIYATVGTPSANGSNYQYTATRLSGSSSGTVPAGEAVVDFGVTNDGRIMLTADDGTNSPYISIATHDKTAPTWTERVRIGNLAGISGLSGYGLWTDNGYFTGTVNATAGYFGSGNTVVAIESGGLSIGVGGAIRGEKNNYADTDAGFFIGYDSSAYKLNIGDANKYIKWTGSSLDIAGTFQTALSGQRLVLGSDNSLKWYSSASVDPVVTIQSGAYQTLAGISLRDAAGVVIALADTASIGDGNFLVMTDKRFMLNSDTGWPLVMLSRDTAANGTAIISADAFIANPASEVLYEGLAYGNTVFQVFGSGKVQAYGGFQTAASSYLSFGATYGSTGYGIRDNAGTMEYKNSGGSWAAMGSGGGGTPGGNNTHVQYNNNGAFGGEGDFTYNATTNTLTVPVVSIGRLFGVKSEDTNAGFDFSTTNSNQDNILIENILDDVEQWGYGGSIGFTRINAVDRKAAIFAYQTGSDGDQIGFGFAVHPSATGGDAMQTGAILDHNGVMSLPYSGLIGLKQLSSPPSSLSLPSGSSPAGQLYLGYDAEADSYTKLLIHADGANSTTTFTDLSGTAKTITNPSNAVTNSTSSYKLGSSSIYFNGTGYLTCADSSDWYFGTGDFTIDTWINFATLPASNGAATICAQYTDGSNDNWLYVFNNGTSGRYEIRYKVRSSGSDTIAMTTCSIPSGALTAGTWHHYAVVRKGNIFSAYFDGKRLGYLNSTASVPDISGTMYIGARDGTNYKLTGYMDGFRISKGIARWHGDFEPPTVSPHIKDSAGNVYVAKSKVAGIAEINFERIEEYSPASGSDVGYKGRICYDDEYLYISVSDTVVKKIALEYI